MQLGALLLRLSGRVERQSTDLANYRIAVLIVHWRQLHVSLMQLFCLEKLDWYTTMRPRAIRLSSSGN